MISYNHKERLEKILKLEDNKSRMKLLFEWVKTNVISLNEFNLLINSFPKVDIGEGNDIQAYTITINNEIIEGLEIIKDYITDKNGTSIDVLNAHIDLARKDIDALIKKLKNKKIKLKIK